MPRVTDSEVKAILATTLDTTPFIVTASFLVDSQLAPFYTDAMLLTQAELYWAAHLVSARDPMVVEKTIADTRVKYHTPKASIGLESTWYGQTVLALDSLGILIPTTEAEGAGVKVASLDVF